MNSCARMTELCDLYNIMSMRLHVLTNESRLKYITCSAICRSLEKFLIFRTPSTRFHPLQRTKVRRAIKDKASSFHNPSQPAMTRHTLEDCNYTTTDTRRPPHFHFVPLQKVILETVCGFESRSLRISEFFNNLKRPCCLLLL